METYFKCKWDLEENVRKNIYYNYISKSTCLLFPITVTLTVLSQDYKEQLLISLTLLLWFLQLSLFQKYCSLNFSVMTTLFPIFSIVPITMRPFRFLITFLYAQAASFNYKKLITNEILKSSCHWSLLQPHV